MLNLFFPFTWTTGDAVVVVVPDVSGLEYKANDALFEYSTNDEMLEYKAVEDE